MERFAIKIDKNLRANLYKICRLCGIDNPDKIKVRDDANIVNLEEGEPELWKKVLDCIGLMITKDDKMPQFMCTLCVDKINDFFEFREMCYATDGQTRKLLGIKGEPKIKVPASVSSSSIDFKTEDIKEPIPEIIPQRGRKRRNADMDISKEIKTDEPDDVKPSNPCIASNIPKKKRLKLSSTETETKLEPGIKSASKAAGIAAKKEPGTKHASTSKTTGIIAKKELPSKAVPKIEPTSKLGLNKKRLKTEPILKDTKKEIKPVKMTKLMKKKLKQEEQPPVQEEQQLTKKRKLELLRQKKLPLLAVKAEKMKKRNLDTKIKEETPVITSNSDPAASGATKMKSKLKEKCKICSEPFINKLHLDKHIKTTHIPSIHRYHCVQCNETLKKNMEIKNHNLWHKLSKTPFKCGNCSESSCSIYTYSKHIRDCNQVAYLDSQIPDWHCPDCSDNYETTYLFNIHSCVSKKLVCPGCEKSLKWKEDYFKHIPICPEAFNRIPPYMTSNIQVKNEAEHPASPLPHTSTVTATTSITTQSNPTARVTPPQMDSNQCVVIPANVSLLEDTGSSSPSKSNRKGKRITKKDLKRFDKLLKSTMTTLVSIKHEPTQTGDSAVPQDEQPPSLKSEDGEVAESPPGSPMSIGCDDFHHNDDDADSADEQTPSKLVGTIKQEIIDEGYRDLYNNIEVNIKHEVGTNKNSAEVSLPSKKTTGPIVVSEESSLTPKPILKLKITKEHGMLNSILMDSPKSEKKKKKKKRKEDRVKSPDKDERSFIDEPMATADTPVNDFAATTEIACPEKNTTVASGEEEKDLTMPLPGIIEIKKEAIEAEEIESVELATNHSTPSIIAASSGSLHISCVSEGVIFNSSDEMDNEMPQELEQTIAQQENLEPEEHASLPQPSAVVETEVSMEEHINPVSSISFASPSVEPALSSQFVSNEVPDEEIDIKPRLEDLIPMLQIVSVTSGEDVNKPAKPSLKRKRRQTVAKPNPIPKILSVSSGSEAALFHPDSNLLQKERECPSEKEVNDHESAFDFSQIKIKAEIVDPGYEKESNIPPQEENTGYGNDNKEVEIEEGEPEEEEEDEEVEPEIESEEEGEEPEEAQVEEAESKESEEDEQIKTAISKKQAEENAYIANIDFNNLTIKQEKEYIDDGLENSVACEEDGSSDTDSDETSSDDDNDEDDSESEREYRELPSENDESDNENVNKITVSQKEIALRSKPIGLQILTVHSEFNCNALSEKTESEEIASDDKLHIRKTDKEELTKIDKILGVAEEGYDIDRIKEDRNQAASMEVDDEHGPMVENPVNDDKTEELPKRESVVLTDFPKADGKLEPVVEKTPVDDKPEELTLGASVVLRDPSEADGKHEPEVEKTTNDDKPDELPKGANVVLRDSSEVDGKHEPVVENPPNNDKSEELPEDANMVLKNSSEADGKHEPAIENPPNNDKSEELPKGVSVVLQDSSEVDDKDQLPKSTNEVLGDSSEVVDKQEPVVENALSDDKYEEIPNNTSAVLKNSSEVDGKHEPVVQSPLNDDKSQEFPKCPSVLLEDSSAKTVFDAAYGIGSVQPSLSEAGNIFPDILSSSDILMPDAVAQVENLTGSSKDLLQTQLNSIELNFNNTNLPELCNDFNSDPDKSFVHNQPFSNDGEQHVSNQMSTLMSFSDESLISSAPAINDISADDVPVVASIVPESCSTSALMSEGGMVSINVLNTVKTGNQMEIDTPDINLSPDLCQSRSSRLLDEAACNNTEPFEKTEQSYISPPDTLDVTVPSLPKVSELLSSPINVSETAQTNYCHMQEDPPTRSNEINDRCETIVDRVLCDLASLNVPTHDISRTSASMQNAISSQLPDALTSVLSYPMDSQNLSTDLPISIENTLQSNFSFVPAEDIPNHTSSALENSNMLSELGNAIANSISDTDPSSNKDRQEFDKNCQLQCGTATINIPPFSTEFNQFNTPESNYATYDCNEPGSSSSRFTEFHDLTPPTAGQLQTSLVEQPVLSEFSTNSLTNLTVLSEEVQNLLTVAVNNFEFNNSALRARSAADPLPNFNDFENLNEIAENNNNANLERELQDELGNVLAVAIADRSNDEMDENNVMNDNRAT